MRTYPATVPDQVEILRRTFGLRRLALIGDRGMLTDARIEDLRQNPGLGWLSALPNHHGGTTQRPIPPQHAKQSTKR